MEKTEWTALIVKAQSGDQGAMEEILRAAHTPVSYQCRKLLRDPQNAEDMTQEVLLVVYTKLGTLKTPEAFWGWLNRTTVNRCLNAMNRNHVELQFAEDEDGHSVLDNLEEMDEQQVPDRALDNAETTRMIEEIVDSLPEAQRICILMYYYDEMSVKEIAETLGVPENTVKSRLNYARKAIKEQVLDYEKKGVKLYGLSPLPFLLHFLFRAASESEDSVQAATVAKQVMEKGMASAAAGGTAVATGTALAHATGGLSAKLIAGVLAGLLLLGGAGAAVVIATRNDEEPEPVSSQIVQGEVPDGPVPADRLALLNDIAYYGEPARCRMTVRQALAFAEIIGTKSAELASVDKSGDAVCYAALIDIGQGDPVLVLACGNDFGTFVGNTPEASPTGLNSFTGKLEVWRYADGQAETVTTAHEVCWKEGVGFMCETRVGGTEDENGVVFPQEAQSRYLDFSADVYGAQGGVLSDSPIASALVQVDLVGDFSSGSIDGQPVNEAVWKAWKQQWDEGGRKSIRIRDTWSDWSQCWTEDGWTSIGVSYNASMGGHVDQGFLDLETVSPGSDMANVLHRYAWESGETVS